MFIHWGNRNMTISLSEDPLAGRPALEWFQNHGYVVVYTSGGGSA
jgi:hypothetical protein